MTFISKNFKKSSKTLALLGMVGCLITSVPDALATETFEEVQRMAQEGFVSSESYPKKQLYDRIREKFLTFWNVRGADSYAHFRAAPSRSSLEANELEMEALEGRISWLLESAKEKFAPWQDSLVEAQKKMIEAELSGTYKEQALAVLNAAKGGIPYIEQQKDKSLRTEPVWEDPPYTPLEQYFRIAERAEKDSLADPDYALLGELWKTVDQYIQEIVSGPVAEQIRCIKLIGPFEIARLVLRDLIKGDSFAVARKVTKAKCNQLVKKRRDFILDIWSGGNFGIGKELLNMLRNACEGLKLEAMKEMPFVKYAEFLPEAFTREVMDPFLLEVLTPVMEQATTTP